MLLEFPSAADAVKCIVAVQQGMAERNGDIDPERRIRFRVGINVGDVVAEGEDLLGDGVNIAARVEGLSEPGGLAISDDAHRQVRDRLDIPRRDGGAHEVKNIARPVHVWHWRPATSVREATSQDTVAMASALSSIAVLPFANMSGDVEQEYFADGIAEDVITALSRVSRLRVIARNCCQPIRALPTRGFRRISAASPRNLASATYWKAVYVAAATASASPPS